MYPFHLVKRFYSQPRQYIKGRPTSVVFRDDDRYWSGGILYNNPDDPDLFVPKRYGLGWTVNIGHPQGKLVIKRTKYTIRAKVHYSHCPLL
jgi:Predicted membrane protein